LFAFIVRFLLINTIQAQTSDITYAFGVNVNNVVEFQYFECNKYFF